MSVLGLESGYPDLSPNTDTGYPSSRPNTDTVHQKFKGKLINLHTFLNCSRKSQSRKQY